MKVYQIPVNNSLRNYTYIIKYANEGEKGISIDPNGGHLIDFLEKEKIQLTHIINTHGHFDHTEGNDLLKKRYSAMILNHLSWNEDQDFSLDDGYSLSMMKIPGHTMDHIGIFLKKNHKIVAMFTGDTLFYAGVGNAKNGGNVETLFDSLTKIFSFLEDDVLIYPGHDYLETNLNFSLNFEKDNSEAKEMLLKLKNHELQLPLRIFQIKKINLFIKYLSNKEKFFELRKTRDSW